MTLENLAMFLGGLIIGIAVGTGIGVVMMERMQKTINEYNAIQKNKRWLLR